MIDVTEEANIEDIEEKVVESDSEIAASGGPSLGCTNEVDIAVLGRTESSSEAKKPVHGMPIDELKEIYWWVTDSEDPNSPRWPIRCIVCDVKLQAQMLSLSDHDNGGKHKNKVLKTNDPILLKNFVKCARTKLAQNLKLNVNAVYIAITSKKVLEPTVLETLMAAEVFRVSFQSHEARITQLAIYGNDVLLCLHRTIIRENIFISKLRKIFEAKQVKVGKDIWFLVALLFRSFGFISTNCYNLHDVKLSCRPVSEKINNSIVKLVANASSLVHILPGACTDEVPEGPLSISEKNMTVMKSLCNFLVEMDDEREEFNQDHWRCFFRNAEVDETGRRLRFDPMPSDHKIRRGSTAVISTNFSGHTGAVKGPPKAGTAQVDVIGKTLLPGDKIIGIDIERYNELNIVLLQSKNYVVSYLSLKRQTLNPFQKLFLLRSHETLPKSQLRKSAIGWFVHQSGKKLNDSQVEAIQNAEHAVSFTVGPPGTGKTTIITAIIAQTLINGGGVLVLGQTNSSVKQVCESLLKNNICGKDQMTLLVSKEYYNKRKTEYDMRYTRHNVKERQTPVLLSTLSKAKQLQGPNLVHFRDRTSHFRKRDLAVVDEGGRISTCSFAEVLPVFDNFTRLVVCGDPNQGDPFSSKQKTFTSVINFLWERANTEQRGIVRKGYLNRQYRMAYDIGELVSKTFYSGKVESEMKPCGRNTFFHHVPGCCKPINSSFYCEEESEIALKYVKTLLVKHRNSSIAVICYYKAQVNLIRAHTDGFRFVQVCTVDSYQGKEAEYVLISTCAQDIVCPFLLDRKRACVATSRGKRRLIVLGNRHTLEKNVLWAGILKRMTCIVGMTCSERAVR